MKIRFGKKLVSGIMVLSLFFSLPFVSAGASPQVPDKAEQHADEHSKRNEERFVVYPKPGDATKESDTFAVTVEQNGVKAASFVNLSEPPLFDKNDPKSGNGKDGAEIYRESGTTQHWTTFSLSGTAQVEVRRLDCVPFESVRVLPSRYGIEAQIGDDGSTVTFPIKPKQKVFLEINGQLIDRMFVFADPLEDPKLVPNSKRGNVFVAKAGDRPLDGLKKNDKVLYFGPGEYNIEEYGPVNTGTTQTDRTGSNKAWVVPSHIEQIYIAGGAIVYGGFFIQHDGVTVNGRGILSGEPLLYHQLNLLEFQAGSKGGYVEGITLADAVHYALRSWDAHYDGANFKVLANWRYNNDGINLTEDSTVEDVYLSGNDDTVKLYFGGATLKNAVIGQMVNGGVFQFGWGFRDVADIHVSNIDIVFVDGRNSQSNLGIINYRPRASNQENREYVIENITFDSIRADGPAIKLIALGLPENQVFRNITIRNSYIHSWPFEQFKNFIKGSTDSSTSGLGRVENIVLDHVQVGDTYLTKDNYLNVGNFETLPPSFVPEVKFIAE
ncbi:hypothetical protein E6C60_0825 [Paenibacillus algicola]|uniref:Uncharacterized protein n=2 Tax=Paenibacillus algicola TaxID=2565926 RepID=A0A4P8XGG6_9BACL|nr:hypothetical protein E6C60_0825 [Paenibacillus algicola]